MKKLLLTALLALGGLVSLHAQVFTQNSMYNFTPFLYNPAAAGMNSADLVSGINLTLMGRSQWTGIEGQPATAAVMLNAPWEAVGGGLGGYMMADQLGPLRRFRVEVGYAFHLDLGNFGQLNIGAGGGIMQNAIVETNWIAPETNQDAVIPGGSLSITNPSLSAGLFYTDPSNRLFVGLSGQDLLEPSIEGITGAPGVGEESTVPRSFYLTTGYKFTLIEDKSYLTPMAMAKTEGSFPPQLDLGVMWQYRPVVFGLSHRFFNDSFAAMLGVNVNDRMFFAYSYDYTLNALNAFGDLSTHEIVLSYTFPSAKREGQIQQETLQKPGSDL